MGFFMSKFKKRGNRIYAPVAGKAVAITEVPDPAFAEELLGKGIAILPNNGKIYAPCDATVISVFDTKHAVCLRADFGAEILIHVGVETGCMEGNGCTSYVGNGDKVKKGQLLIEADLEKIRAAGHSTHTPVIICNVEDYSAIDVVIGKTLTNDDVVIKVKE